MTATVGSRPARCSHPATGAIPHPRAARPEPERQQQLLLALTEHFTLRTARAATVADSNARSVLYLATVSSAAVASAFPARSPTSARQAFFLFAPALLGVLIHLRLVQTAVEDLFYARAINRIRRRYVDLHPDAARWFLLRGHDDPPGVVVSVAWPPSTGRAGSYETSARTVVRAATAASSAAVPATRAAAAAKGSGLTPPPRVTPAMVVAAV
jgi:hypothetical protein